MGGLPPTPQKEKNNIFSDDIRAENLLNLIIVTLG